MIATSFAIPPEDAWLVSRLCRIISSRLVYGTDTSDARRGLLRALFGLQRLPAVESELSISICAGRHQFEFSQENFGFISYTDDWHTEFRIQFFASSNHCIHIFEMLEGEARRHAAEFRLDEFEADMQEPDAMSIEDLSTAGPIDEPPIDSHLYGAHTDDEP